MTALPSCLLQEPDFRSASGLTPERMATTLAALEAVVGVTSEGSPVTSNRPFWVVGHPSRTTATFETTARKDGERTRLTLVGDVCCTFETTLSYAESADMPRSPCESADEAAVLAAVRAYALFWEHQIRASEGQPRIADANGSIAEATLAIAALTRGHADANGLTVLHVRAPMPWGAPTLRGYAPDVPIHDLDPAVLGGHAVRFPSRIHVSAMDLSSSLHVEFTAMESVIEYAKVDMVQGMRAVMRRTEAA